MDLTRRGILVSAPATLIDGPQKPKVDISDWSTPEKFGAYGDGNSDDQDALASASDWLNAAPSRGLVLRGTYRIGRRLQSRFALPGGCDFVKEGAITIIHPRNVALIFEGGRLLMDNLNPKQVGDQFHGVVVRGLGSGLWLRKPNVSWRMKPSSRSQGDGIRLYGYPSDQMLGAKGDGKLERIFIEGSYVQWAPQAGIIFCGCSDINLDFHTSNGTLADGCHFNACRNIRVGTISGMGCGDDVCALVTYFDDKSFEGVIPGTSPYSQPTLTAWSNSEASISRITATSSNASGLRLAGSFKVTVGHLSAKDCLQGVISDGGGGGRYIWTYMQSRASQIGGITAEGCRFGFRGRSLQPKGPAFSEGAISVGRLEATDCPDAGLALEGFSGFEAGDVVLTRSPLLLDGADDCDIRSIQLQSTAGVIKNSGTISKVTIDKIVNLQSSLNVSPSPKLTISRQ